MKTPTAHTAQCNWKSNAKNSTFFLIKLLLNHLSPSDISEVVTKNFRQTFIIIEYCVKNSFSLKHVKNAPCVRYNTIAKVCSTFCFSTKNNLKYKIDVDFTSKRKIDVHYLIWRRSYLKMDVERKIISICDSSHQHQIKLMCGEVDVDLA